jgi:hypothetical protein
MIALEEIIYAICYRDVKLNFPKIEERGGDGVSGAVEDVPA